MNENDVAIRPYRPGDEEKIIKLLSSTFVSWQRQGNVLDYWRWKFEGYPLGRSNIYVAEYDSRIVGTDARRLLYVSIGGNRILCEHVVDVAIHPDFRRQGLFEKIDEQLNAYGSDSGVKLHYGSDSIPFLTKRTKKMGAFHPAHRVVNLIWIKDMGRYTKIRPGYPFVKQLTLNLMHSYSLLRNPSLRKEEKNNSPMIKTVNQFDGSADTFWYTVVKDYDCIVERNREYLNWRYCDPRTGPYTVKIASHSKEMLGYVVLKAGGWKHGYTVGQIVDLLALPDRMDVVESLIIESMKYFEGAGANEVWCWMMANHPYNRLLQQHCFLDLRQNAHFNFILFAHDDTIFDAITGRKKNVYLVYGDSDWA